MPQSMPPADVKTSERQGNSLAAPGQSHLYGGVVFGGLGLRTVDDSGSTFDVATNPEDTIVLCGTTNNGGTITLSTPDQAGRVVHIVDQDGNAGTNAITIDTEGSENVQGSSSITISSNREHKSLVWDGSNWFAYS